jgi:pimeloyl-ACP methyl ester carboxylesterase
MSSRHAPNSSSIGRVLEARLRRPAAWPHRDTSGTLVLASTTNDERWTVCIRRGEGSLERGCTRTPTAIVHADAETLYAVLNGAESGLDAFLAGRLGVRGNVGLALKLDLFFPPERQPTISPGLRVAGGIETFYLDAGPRDAPVVVLLHGLGATSVSMLPALAELARDYRVIAPDLPGFGESAKPGATYDFGWTARWLSAFLDVLGIERASLVGNSMGGRISIEFGLSEPHRTDRLVLLAPSMAWFAFRHFVPLVRILRPELGALPLRALRWQVAAGVRACFADPRRAQQTWLDAAIDEFLHYFRSRAGRVAFFSAARQIYLEEARGNSGFWDRLPALQSPSLFVWGDRDRLVPHRFAAHTKRALPAATSVTLENCGHVPQWEARDRVGPMMREFLARPRVARSV